MDAPLVTPPAPSAPEPGHRASRSGRLAGIDAARGLAIAGMLLSHFARVERPDDPGWLQAIDNIPDGRAAPLFCVLLGLGAGLLSRRGGGARLVRRGVAILAIGIAIWPLIERVYLILPQYGVLLALCALAIRLPTRRLLPAAVACWLIPTLLVAFVDGHGLRAGLQPDTYGDLRDVKDIAWHIIWSGGYPGVGWLGFALVGLWLSRQRLGDAAVQARLVIGGAAVALLQPVAAALLDAAGGRSESPDARGVATFLDSTAHSNQLAWYVVSAATATAVIAALLWVARRWRAVQPLTALGRFAFTAYLLHLLIGSHVVWPWRDRVVPSLAAQLVAALATLAGLIVVAALWLLRYRRGPVESAVRAVAR